MSSTATHQGMVFCLAVSTHKHLFISCLRPGVRLCLQNRANPANPGSQTPKCPQQVETIHIHNVHIYIHTYIYIYIKTNICVDIYIYIHIYIIMCPYIHIHMYVYIICLYVYIHMYINVFCTHIYIYKTINPKMMICAEARSSQPKTAEVLISLDLELRQDAPQLARLQEM